MRTVMDAEGVGRALRRISHEIVEASDGVADLIVVGIHTRGVPMAHRIAGLVSEITHVDVPVGSLDVSRYRDDRGDGQQAATGRACEVPIGVSGRTVVLVDDVLYTGRTARAALEALNESGRAAGVQLAVLIDRGHRELPIRADYVGKNLPTSAVERVTVRLCETDGIEDVVIESAVGSPAGGRAGG